MLRSSQDSVIALILGVSLGLVAMLTSFRFWLIVWTVLTAYLGMSVWLRRRAEQSRQQARLRAIDREFPPRTFDPSAIAPQLRRIREDYAAALQQQWHLAHYRAGLVAAARRQVKNLSYFSRSRHEEELHKHDP